MQTGITQEEFKKAVEIKSWIYRTPPPPNKFTPRKARRGKVVILFQKEVRRDG